MTLPTTGPISLTDVMNELRTVNSGRAYPISLGDSDVRNLAGVPSGPISLTDLRGKTAVAPYTPMSVSGNGDYVYGYSGAGGGTLYAHPGINVSGGAPPYTFSWSFTSNPSGCGLINPTAQSCTVSKSYSGNTVGSATAVLQCWVSDTQTSVLVSNITVTLEWDF